MFERIWRFFGYPFRTTCPYCGLGQWKVMMLGFPMKLCPDPECSCAWGFWSGILQVYFDGNFIRYRGSYLMAMWAFIRGEHLT